MNDKIKLLIKIARIYNENNITWNLGAACMLYLRGIVKKFDDIDLMVSLKDVNKVEEIMSKYCKKSIEETTSQYKTKVFLEYIIDDIDVDVMAGFTIVKNGKDYYFPLEPSENSDFIVLDNTEIYLEKVEKWLEYYKLMGRRDKISIIENHIVRQG